MFGSKQLLIAYVIGSVGIALVVSSLADTLESGEMIRLIVGLCAIWASALFGPVLVMQEKGVTKFGDDAGKDG